MKNPHNLQTAIQLLGFVGLLWLIFTWNLTKAGVGAVLAIAAVFFPKLVDSKKLEGGTADVEYSLLKFSVKGGLRFAMLVGGLVLMITGGNALREEIPRAVAQEIQKRAPHDAANTSRETDLK